MASKRAGRVDGRDVVRCECGLTQFPNEAKLCRRCKEPLAGRRELAAVEVAEPVKIIPPLVRVTETLPLVIKVIRDAHGFSQRDLAKIMVVPRTYISKVENGKATPTIGSLEHFAESLDASPYALIAISERALA